MKKNETLEEAVDRLLYTVGKDGIVDRHTFIAGVKWQQERMYSEEEVLVILHKRDMYKWEEHLKILSLKEWFEQFKKKQ